LKYSLPSPDRATIHLILIFSPVLLVLSCVIALRLFRFKESSDNDGAEETAPVSSWGVQAMGYLLSFTLQPENFLRCLTYVEVSFRRLFRVFVAASTFT
jgi:hypothetical protein